MSEEKKCDRFDGQLTCLEFYSCCDCGDHGCGCRYCWSCGSPCEICNPVE